MPEHNDDNMDWDQEAPSKSQLKRDMHALQELGRTLVELSDKQLAKMPLEDALLEAVQECQRIRSNSARKRHIQYIGKLIRDMDAEPIALALSELDAEHRQKNDAFHDLEQLREDILRAGPEGISLALTRWPDADRQKLRQLVLQHQREISQQKPPAASRKLFRYLRELQEGRA